MPRRSSNEDINETASRILRQATNGQETVESVLAELRQRLTPEQLVQLGAAILGSKGGRSGGLARAERLSSEQRSRIAKKAAMARWSSKG